MRRVRSTAGRARGKRVVAALEDDSDGGEEAAQAAPSPAQVSTAHCIQQHQSLSNLPNIVSRTQCD